MEKQGAREDKTIRPGLRQLHFWLTALLFIVITAHHYGRQLGLHWLLGTDASLGLTRGSIDRIVYLAPVIYANYIFGRRGGIMATFIALLLMLPRALYGSLSPGEAMLETIFVTLIGVAGSIWLNLGRTQKREFEQARASLERIQAQLRSQVQVSIEQQKKLATFTTFSALLSQSLEIGQVLQTGMHMVMETMAVDLVLVFSLDEPNQELHVIAFEGISREAAAGADHIKLGEGLNGSVAKTGQPLVVDNMEAEPRRLARPSLREANLHASVIVPLLARGKIIGTLTVGSRSPRRFDPSEVELLTAMGNQIGITMENSRLYQDQNRMVEQLRLSEERFRQLFENAHDAIWVQDLSGKNIAANDAAAQLIGYSVGDEIVGRDVRDYIPPESLILAREIRDRLLRNETVDQPYEQRLIRKDGSEVILKLTTSLLTSGGKPSAFQHIARDITTERRLQENLRYYVQQITETREEESKRISRELHDSTAQSLIAALHQLENFCQDNPELAMRDSRFLWNMREKLRDILQEVRQFSRDLRPSILDDLGLLPSVEWLVEELRRNSKVAVSLSITGLERRFPPEVEVALFRITQEALRNITKHAGATRVEVRIGFLEKETIVTIIDNGKGFELPGSLSELPRTGKLGIVGMQERARLIGGRLEIASAPGQGTMLKVVLPIERI